MAAPIVLYVFFLVSGGMLVYDVEANDRSVNAPPAHEQVYNYDWDGK